MNNPWKIVLLKIHWFSFHFIFVLVFGYCLSLCFLVCGLPYRELEEGLVPSLEEFESRSKGPTTLRAIGLRSTPNWVNHQRENNHQNWVPCCNFVIDNLLTFIGSKLGASNRSPYFHLCVIILVNFPLGLWVFCWEP